MYLCISLFLCLSVYLFLTVYLSIFLSPKIYTSTSSQVLILFSFDRMNRYGILQSRALKQFNRYEATGTMLSNYACILVLLLRLRQLCSHKNFYLQSIQKDKVFFGATVHSLSSQTHVINLVINVIGNVGEVRESSVFSWGAAGLFASSWVGWVLYLSRYTSAADYYSLPSCKRLLPQFNKCLQCANMKKFSIRSNMKVDEAKDSFERIQEYKRRCFLLTYFYCASRSSVMHVSLPLFKARTAVHCAVKLLNLGISCSARKRLWQMR